MVYTKKEKDLLKNLSERVKLIEKTLKESPDAKELQQQIAKMQDVIFAAKDFFDVTEACSFLGLSKSQLYKLTRTLSIPHYKRGGKIYFDRGELVQWIKENPVKTRLEHEQDAMKYIMNKPLKRR